MSLVKGEELKKSREKAVQGEVRGNGRQILELY